MNCAASLLVSVALALPTSQLLFAQAADDASDAAREQPDEVIVRGRRLADFRAELHAARIRVYDLFNDLNSDDAFDVHCEIDDSTGTRMRQQTCRPQFRDEVAADAAKAWVSGIRDACGGQLNQECIFSDAANLAKSRALAEEGREPIMQQRFADEMARVVRDHPEMQQALLDYETVERAYEEALDGRRGRAREASR